jgi:hypothetical protein
MKFILNLGFKEILIYLTSILTMVFFYLLSKKTASKNPIGRKYSRLLIKYGFFTLNISYFLTTLYSIYVGFRPTIYFILLGFIFITNILLIKVQNNFSKIQYVLLLLVVLSIPISIYGCNRFYPLQDTLTQIKHLKIEINKGSYYYLIPIDPLIRTSINNILGSNFTIINSLIFEIFFMTAIISGILSLFDKLTKNNLNGVIAVFLLIATPSLTFFGRLYPLSYVIFYIILCILLYQKYLPSLTILNLITLPMIFYHPSGFVTSLMILLPPVILKIKNWPYMGQNSEKLRLPLLILYIITFAYWIHTYLISLMVRQGVKFQKVLLSYFAETVSGGMNGAVSAIYTPRYYLEGFKIFSYAWAIPVALSAAFLLHSFIKIFKRKKIEREYVLFNILSIVGLSTILIAFIFSQMVETAQYLIPIGYFLLILPASASTVKLFNLKNKGYLWLVSITLIFFIFLGSSSPNWAPLENPEFETVATIKPYYIYLERETLTPLIPDVLIYNDYDFPVGTSGLYKPVREIIFDFVQRGDAHHRSSPITLFGLRGDRSLNKIDIHDYIYYSGYHRVIAVK